MKLIRGKTPRPQKILLYGGHGEGKSTFAAQIPGAAFVQTEDGLAFIDCAKTPLVHSTAELYEAIELLTSDQEVKWIVIDTIDWTEQVLRRSLCEEKKWDSIESPGFGKGYSIALEQMQQLLRHLEGSVSVGKNILLIGHAQIRTVSPPGEESYDRWEPKLHKLTNPVVQEWCDHVLFVASKTLSKQEEQGFGKERRIAKSFSERQLFCSPSPMYAAKNRAGLPTTMPFEFSVLRNHLKEGFENG
jgi:hypothetical protein